MDSFVHYLEKLLYRLLDHLPYLGFVKFITLWIVWIIVGVLFVFIIEGENPYTYIYVKIFDNKFFEIINEGIGRLVCRLHKLICSSLIACVVFVMLGLVLYIIPLFVGRSRYAAEKKSKIVYDSYACPISGTFKKGVYHESNRSKSI